MASEQLEADKNSQELTGAALELAHDGKNDNDNADAVNTMGTEAASELPIRDMPKDSKMTPDEKRGCCGRCCNKKGSNSRVFQKRCISTLLRRRKIHSLNLAQLRFRRRKDS